MSSPFYTDYMGNLSGFHWNKREALQDIFTIASNLGFNIGLCDIPKQFQEECTVLYEKSDKVFMKYRVYKNGNMHVRFDLEFTKALNVEVSRLLGWIRRKEDIKKEFPEKMAQGAEKYFKQNFTCLGKNIMPLLAVRKKQDFEHTVNIDELAITIKSPYKECLKTILGNIDKLNNINEFENYIEKCIKILDTEKGIIYKNCLIMKNDNITKIEFRNKNDFEQFRNLFIEKAA